MLLVELLVLRNMGMKQKFSIVNINMVEGTKYNIKVMVNIDKLQLTKLEVEDHWSQEQENDKCNNLNIWKHRMKKSISYRSLLYKIFLGLLMLWGRFMQKIN